MIIILNAVFQIVLRSEGSNVSTQRYFDLVLSILKFPYITNA